MMKGALNRRVPKEILTIFEKYMDNNVRNLEKKDALSMLQHEFGLELDQAETMFETFDKDKNGIMSIWEFQQFYTCMGNHAKEVVAKFKELDADGSGKLDPDEAKEGLKTLKTATGRPLDPKEIDFFLETTVDEEGLIDLGAFTALLHRLRLYNAPPPAAGVKIKSAKSA